MSSVFEEFDGADGAARRAHAARITAVAKLLDTYPQASLASMLSVRSQISIRTARAWVREAEGLRDLPDLADAYGRGEVSGDQVAALCVLAEPGTDGVWVETLASPLGREDFRINTLERMARKERARQLERSDGGRYLRMAPTRDERFVRGRFQLHPEEAAALEQQLDARIPRDTGYEDIPAAHADALLALVADAAGAHNGTGTSTRNGTSTSTSNGSGNGRVKATVVVRSEPAVLRGESEEPGELSNGCFVPAHVVRGMARDGKLVELDVSGVGLDTKTIPAPVRAWVHHRDGGRCRGIDCPTPTLDVEEHHMLPRSQHGTHHPSNVILLCVICHQIRIHREGWRVVGDAEGEVTWIRPDGTVYRPPPVVRRLPPPDT